MTYLHYESNYVRPSLIEVVETMRAKQKMRVTDENGVVGAHFRHFPSLFTHEGDYSPRHDGEQRAQYYGRQQLAHACKSNCSLSVARLHK